MLLDYTAAMTTVTLPDRIEKQLEQLAAAQGVSVEELTQHLLREQLRTFRRRALSEEMTAFCAQYSRLIKEFPGQYVAVYQGKVIDHDPDGGTLHRRIYKSYGDLPVLIVQVRPSTPEQEFTRLAHHLEP